ncbi:hypothetical protein JK191_02255 [Gluconobacter sphaericus]|nr:hypothetical protein [Gluconobacter sphaericus]MBS1096409.1 hypothetical protein [Gluconobacter sphaericus]MBS1099767.1 hypothetical protein [Gluconobacter sphaericus]QQX92278.1 hypothetical protein IGS75_03650 [Gluconobacter sphaericus]
MGGCSDPEGVFTPDSAAVRAFRTRLNSQPSATAALQARCSNPIRVVRLSVDRPVTEDILTLLQVREVHQVTTRHVRLLCGETVLSDAWNWYVPERLSPAMNTLLEQTDTPFGRAVQQTAFRRQRLETRFPGRASGIVLENRALLRRGVDDAPISLVVEDYLPAAIRP